jgi:hypothetical protein
VRSVARHHAKGSIGALATFLYTVLCASVVRLGTVQDLVGWKLERPNFGARQAQQLVFNYGAGVSGPRPLAEPGHR